VINQVKVEDKTDEIVEKLTKLNSIADKIKRLKKI